MKKASLTVSAGLLFVLLFSSCGTKSGESKKQNDAVDVYTIESVRERITWDIVYPAKVAGVEVKSKVSGTLKEIRYEEGKYIKKGAKMFLVDKPAHKAAYDRASVDMARIKREFEKSRDNLRTAKAVYDKGQMKKKDYNAAAAAHKEVDSRYKNAQNAMKEAETQLKNTNVTAPVSGIAGMSIHKIGTEISEKNGNELLTYIFHEDPIKAAFTMPKEHADNFLSGFLRDKAKIGGEIKKGAIPVEAIFSDGAAYAVKGSIVSMTKKEVFGGEQIYVYAEFSADPKSEAVIPGQDIGIRISGAYYEDAVLALKSCIFKNSDSSFVYTVQPDGTLAPVPVTYEPYGEYALITSGLNGGENLVCFASGGIEAGTKVNARRRYFSVPDNIKTGKSQVNGTEKK